MSQIIVFKDKRVCDLLPLSVATFSQLPAKPSKDTNEWTSIRPTLIQDFIRVVPRPKVQRAYLPYAVVYAGGVHPGTTDKKMTTVGLELYGYLAHVHVGECGNWTLIEEDIPRATWNLRIVGGPLSDIFNQQADALWEIEQHVLASIQGHGLSVADMEKGREELRQGIFVNCRVFHKVRDGKPERNLATSGPAAKYHAKWRIPDCPQLGQRQQNGTIRACRPEQFRRGDFVQLSVQFSVERKIFPKRGSVNLRLQLNQIILLVPAKDTGEAKAVPSLDIEGMQGLEDSDVREAPAFQQTF
ncbi:hypothetical protein K488DRAFT_88398 [Vararia minispora EC-137]|uniref:Uncharacterized protein n=1 Tax=Vararia minispora EC-137 TaxID=1314806 RepID=A0ACB8QDX6_9AGAM|nr:hypothetical protein K488DRAFT_88398 [Vararia minispora EC-137]